MQVEWSDNLLLGIAHIDEQHKGLFKLLNELYAEIDQGRGYKVLHDTIAVLAGYSKIHFISEENYMDIKAYEHRYAHKVLHEDFHRKVSEYTARVLEGESDFAP